MSLIDFSEVKCLIDDTVCNSTYLCHTVPCIPSALTHAMSEYTDSTLWDIKLGSNVCPEVLLDTKTWIYVK